MNGGYGVNGRRPSNAAGGDFAKPDALALSGFHKASQCLRHFLNRQPLIPPVQIINVDAIDTQFLKAFIKTLLKESFAIVVREPIVALVRITNPDPPFCRDREKITGCRVIAQILADHGFAIAATIQICRVEMVNPQVITSGNNV